MKQLSIVKTFLIMFLCFLLTIICDSWYSKGVWFSAFITWSVLAFLEINKHNDK